MSQDKIFPEGFITKPPRDTAPEWVLGTVSIKVEEAVEFLNTHAKNGWVNLDLLRSAKGAPYLQLNTWEPKKDQPKKEEAGDLPF
jgi:hypothetical protein